MEPATLPMQGVSLGPCAQKPLSSTDARVHPRPHECRCASYLGLYGAAIASGRRFTARYVYVRGSHSRVATDTDVEASARLYHDARGTSAHQVMVDLTDPRAPLRPARPNNSMCICMENMFNAVDRDALVDELHRHRDLAPLARYVVNLYPPGMASVARITGEWRRLNTERGLAQGRCLSPMLSSVLLLPCIQAIEAAMIAAVGVSRQQFCRTCGVAAYLDDFSIVAPPHIAAVGLRAFQAAVAHSVVGASIVSIVLQ